MGPLILICWSHSHKNHNSIQLWPSHHASPAPFPNCGVARLEKGRRHSNLIPGKKHSEKSYLPQYFDSVHRFPRFEARALHFAATLNPWPLRLFIRARTVHHTPPESINPYKTGRAVRIVYPPGTVCGTANFSRSPSTVVVGGKKLTLHSLAR